MHFIDLFQVDALLPPPFLFLFVVECFSQSSACLFSMNDKNNAHVDRSFSYMRLESEESMDPTNEDVRREKEKVSNMVSIEDSTFSAIVKVRKRKFSLEMVVYLILWSFQKVHPFKFDHKSKTTSQSYPALTIKLHLDWRGFYTAYLAILPCNSQG